MKLKEAEAAAAAYDKTLRADDSRFGGYVLLVHEDGSTFHWESAFMMTWGDYFLVFTEHHNYYAYHKDEVVLSRMLDPLVELEPSDSPDATVAMPESEPSSSEHCPKEQRLPARSALVPGRHR